MFAKRKGSNNMEQITLGSGCFWCTEAVFSRLKGVESAVSGYSGGEKKDPTYKEVCAGTTGHAEVVQVTFDPNVISLEAILEVFWKTHDPTTLNRQGGDIGTQYRSAVYYHSAAQKETAEHVKKALSESGAWSAPIVTEITAFEKFWPAEDYHQTYFELNGSQPYCQMVVGPKVEKFKKVFAEKLK
jgi:peptide-methionine (S)-S-oxide reductase